MIRNPIDFVLVLIAGILLVWSIFRFGQQHASNEGRGITEIPAQRELNDPTLYHTDREWIIVYRSGARFDGPLRFAMSRNLKRWYAVDPKDTDSLNLYLWRARRDFQSAE